MKKPPNKRQKLSLPGTAVNRPSYSFEELVSICIEAKKTERRSPRTIKTYMDTTRYFKRWLDASYPNISPCDITVKTIREYLNYITYKKEKYDDHPFHATKEAGLSEETVNTRIRYLKALFSFLHAESYIDHNPLIGIKQQRIDIDKIEAFSEEQIKLLLGQPNRNNFVGHRDYVIMLLMLDTGIRIGELLQLKVKYLDLRSNFISLPSEITKTKRARELPLSRQTAKELSKLLGARKVTSEDPVFTNAYGETYYPTAFNKRLKGYANKVGITGVRVSPHTFRHTFAKFYILAGGDPFSLQRILGHTDLRMVRRYVQMNSLDIRSRHNLFSPVENLGLKRGYNRQCKDP